MLCVGGLNCWYSKKKEKTDIFVPRGNSDLEFRAQGGPTRTPLLGDARVSESFESDFRWRDRSLRLRKIRDSGKPSVGPSAYHTLILRMRPKIWRNCYQVFLIFHVFLSFLAALRVTARRQVNHLKDALFQQSKLGRCQIPDIGEPKTLAPSQGSARFLNSQKCASRHDKLECTSIKSLELAEIIGMMLAVPWDGPKWKRLEEVSASSLEWGVLSQIDIDWCKTCRWSRKAFKSFLHLNLFCWSNCKTRRQPKWRLSWSNLYEIFLAFWIEKYEWLALFHRRSRSTQYHCSRDFLSKHSLINPFRSLDSRRNRSQKWVFTLGKVSQSRVCWCEWLPKPQNTWGLIIHEFDKILSWKFEFWFSEVAMNFILLLNNRC